MATLVICVLLVVAGTVWGLLDNAVVKTGSAIRRHLGTAVVIALMVFCVGGAAAFTAERGSPVTEAQDAWNQFKRGGNEPTFRSARLGSLGGTNRYDYWRVAWRNFTEHPLIGVGGDNFGRAYLLHGNSPETPRYPHSVELRTLSETGLIGFLLLGGALVAAFVAAGRRLRRTDGIAAVSAAIGIILFAYFIAHGSLDRFWEFPALGAAAFALLGLATGVGADPSKRFAPLLTRARMAAGAVVFALLVVGVTLPWFAEQELRGARAIAGDDPSAALTKLARARRLNPLSPQADETAGVIERRVGQLEGAEDRFGDALEIDPGNPFPYLQLALIAAVSEKGQGKAIRLVDRARELNPRDAVTKRVQRRLRAGRPIDPEVGDRWILDDLATRTGQG